VRFEQDSTVSGGHKTETLCLAIDEGLFLWKCIFCPTGGLVVGVFVFFSITFLKPKNHLGVMP